MSRSILDLLSLETRVNPAGVYTSSLTGTTLTLTGTDASESISIRDDGVGVTITGVGDTVIDSFASVTIPTAVTSIKIVAKGGDDTVSLDQTAPLSLSGKLDIDLGDSTVGNNFNLVTPVAISLGGLRLYSGDGPNQANVGGSTATVAGDVTANFGDGASELFLQTGTTIQGNLRVRGGLGFSNLKLDGVNVNKSVSFNPGDGVSGMEVVASIIDGNVRITAGRGDDTLSLDNTTIKGPAGLVVLGGLGKVTASTTNLDVILTTGGVSLRSADNDATLEIGASLNLTTGSTSVIGRTATVNANAEFRTKNLTVLGPAGATFNGNGGTVFIGGDARVGSVLETAGFNMNGATLDARGRINVVGNAAGMQFNSNGNVTVAGDISVLAVTRTASFDRNNSSQFSFNGNVTVRGAAANVIFGAGFGQVAKNLVVNATSDALNFTVSGTVTFGGNVTITGRNAPATVSVNSRTSSVGGNLAIQTGNDADNIAINGMRVTGATTIRTAGGSDTISIDDGASFTGPTLIDAGAGDDFLQFARANGLFADAVTFTGKATIRGGRGNDRLELGRSVADGGDGFSRASFGAGSSVDGGANLNSFDDELSQTVGDPTILNWTDPTTP